MSNQITTATVTNHAYRAGQRALREAVSVGCAPNWALAQLIGPDFHAGFRAEWDDISLYSEIPFYDERVAKLAADRIAQDYWPPGPHSQGEHHEHHPISRRARGDRHGARHRTGGPSCRSVTG